MAVFGKIGQLFGIDDDEYEDEDYYDEEYEEAEDIKVKPSQPSKNKTLALGGKMPDCIFAKPKRFDECFTIADKIRERHVVVINFDSVTQPIAHRLVDFLSGVAYACDSQIKQIAKDTHMVVPASCEYDDITEALEQTL